MRYYLQNARDPISSLTHLLGAGAALVIRLCALGGGKMIRPLRKTQQLPANDRTVALPEPRRQLLNALVMGRLGLVILGVCIAAGQAGNQKHGTDSAADFPQTTHTSAKGGRQYE